jgi:S-formylglutathione hydrolase FrmB
MYVWCGEQDRGHEYSERFSRILTGYGVPHLYESSEGDHSWRWWDKHIQSALDYLLKNV